MEKTDTKGQVISGDFGKIIIRQKSNSRIEIGELLVSETGNEKIIFQVYDLLYSSQISPKNLELISGLALEEDQKLEFLDPSLRNYTVAYIKPLLSIVGQRPKLCKTLPEFFSKVKKITKDDFAFLTKPQNSIYLGKLRSGSSEIDIDVFLDGNNVFSHHVLIAATTGRGKSNLTSVILWDATPKEYCGILVLDPHDEYYGRNKFGLKDITEKNKLSYYTSKQVPPGQYSLKINILQIKPEHFEGVVEWSTPQYEALRIYYKHFGEKWIESIILEKKIESVNFFEGTIQVIKRRLLNLLDLEFANNQLFCHGVFDIKLGTSTISQIINDLENSKTVIIDTSNFSGQQEILIGSILTSEIFKKYKYYKTKSLLDQKPVISIVIEEAPRVLGKEIIEKGPNIFSTIAREGRKFKVGLMAITQLPSLIPREVLANINTKIILGLEMAPERQAIIESSAQDLSQDSRNIASLDKGEAIVSSNFAYFAIPIKIPLFENYAKQSSTTKPKQSFSELKN